MISPKNHLDFANGLEDYCQIIRFDNYNTQRDQINMAELFPTFKKLKRSVGLWQKKYLKYFDFRYFYEIFYELNIGEIYMLVL